MEFHYRKSPRMPKFDYSGGYYYFVTICTHEKKKLFGKPKELNRFGEITRACLEKISDHYPNVEVLKHVVMPNHVHAIIHLNAGAEASLLQIIGQYKMTVTKQIHKISPGITVWQRSFHDHVIRNTEGFQKIWEYMENNPLKWEEDCFYQTE